MSEMAGCQHEDVELLQHIAQGSSADISQHSDGICRALTERWITICSTQSDPEAASEMFGNAINQELPALMNRQLGPIQEIKELRSQQSQITAEVKGHYDAFQSKIAFAKGLSSFTPEQAHIIETASNDFKAATQPLVEQGNRLVERSNALKQFAPHLECTSMATSAPLANLEAELGKHLIKDGALVDGMYLIGLESRNGAGHAVGIQIDSEEGVLKFMDPNTGEFQCGHPEDLVNLLIVHVNKMGYMGSYSSFSMDRYAPPSSP
ncbi:YopT-type cysteine protease domain-containing protein [Myxococcus stipitatus]|uniref:YopT-type cysteine protease domain-containing protein n=1 Tax=Myxococcus stipitatus TaxID=83455 RepID=UPI0031452BE2